jgi:predicted transcriptional regulator
MSTTMTIRIEDEVKDRLDRLAESTQRSKSFLAAEAIREYVDSESAEGSRRRRLRIRRGCRRARQEVDVDADPMAQDSAAQPGG